jgi:hypothetical protein
VCTDRPANGEAGLGVEDPRVDPGNNPTPNLSARENMPETHKNALEEGLKTPFCRLQEQR